MSQEQIIGEDKMEKMSVAPPEPEGASKPENDRREQKELDEGLEETFPASDPPANTQPGHNEPVPSSGYDEEDEKAKK